MLFIDHRQANAAGLWLLYQLTVFFPAVQGGQWVEFPFNRPIRANHRVGPPHQPNAHDLLQHIRPL